MELISEQYIAQTQDKVWEALNDPEVLKSCITGCDSIEKISDSEYKVAVFAAVGPLKARFNGKLIMMDVVPPDSYALNFEGSGGVAGFGKGHATIKLSPEGAGTKLSYVVKVTVGGKLAQIGSRLIDGVGKKMSEEFFAAFNARVGDPVLQGDAGGTAGSAASATAVTQPASASTVSATAGSALPQAAPATFAGPNAAPVPPVRAAQPASAKAASSATLPWILFVASVVIGVLAYLSK